MTSAYERESAMRPGPETNRRGSDEEASKLVEAALHNRRPPGRRCYRPRSYRSGSCFEACALPVPACRRSQMLRRPTPELSEPRAAPAASSSAITHAADVQGVEENAGSELRRMAVICAFGAASALSRATAANMTFREMGQFRVARSDQNMGAGQPMGGPDEPGP